MAKILILDDEPDGTLVLQTIVERFCPHLEVVAACTHPKQALAAVREKNPDILLVDIEMPYMSGIEFVKYLPDREGYITIFVTAFDSHALDAIKLNSFDYLLKPVQKDEVIKSLNRAYQKVKSKTTQESIEGCEKMSIPTNNGIHFVSVNAILYLQAEGNYSIVVLDGGERIVSSRGLKEFEGVLPKQLFIRVHQSFIVNFRHVKQFLKNDGGYLLLENDVRIPISRRKKEDFFEFLRQNQYGIR